MTDTWTWFEGAWHPGNHPIMGPRTHAAWLGTTVFDGARAFDGAMPDLDRHMQRVNASATSFLLKPVVSVEQWIALAHEGRRALRAGRRTLHPPDVLARAWRGRRRRAFRSGLDALVPVHLPRTDARSIGHGDHALAVSAPDDRMCAGRGEGRLPLSQWRAGAHRGAPSRLRQLRDARHARQRRGNWRIPTSFWSRTASCRHRCRTAHSSTA